MNRAEIAIDDLRKWKEEKISSREKSWRNIISCFTASNVKRMKKKFRTFRDFFFRSHEEIVIEEISKNSFPHIVLLRQSPIID